MMVRHKVELIFHICMDIKIDSWLENDFGRTLFSIESSQIYYLPIGLCLSRSLKVYFKS